MRKTGFIMIIAMMLAGCKKTQDLADINYIPGTYTGTSDKGKNGTLKVEVTFTENKLTDIEITEQNESPGIARPALQKIPQEIVQEQSLDVDLVSGATITSKAIIDAVEDAVRQAADDS